VQYLRVRRRRISFPVSEQFLHPVYEKLQGVVLPVVAFHVPAFVSKALVSVCASRVVFLLRHQKLVGAVCWRARDVHALMRRVAEPEIWRAEAIPASEPDGAASVAYRRAAAALHGRPGGSADKIINKG